MLIRGRLKLNEENTVYDEIGEGYDYVKLGNDKISIWAFLKRFLFEDSRIKSKVKYLSGGEKGRLILAKLLKNDSNFIILDEPTNDLDLQTLRLLEEALSFYQGCVILVSHDRYFMDRICNGIIALDGKGKANYYVGNYFYYKEKYANNDQDENNKKAVCKKSIQKRKKLKMLLKIKLTWKEKFELESMEENVLELEDKISEIENKFADPEFYKKYAENTEKMNNKLSEYKAKLEKLYIRWEELEDKNNN